MSHFPSKCMSSHSSLTYLYVLLNIMYVYYTILYYNILSMASTYCTCTCTVLIGKSDKF
jgi:hypothetical protein